MDAGHLGWKQKKGVDDDIRAWYDSKAEGTPLSDQLQHVLGGVTGFVPHGEAAQRPGFSAADYLVLVEGYPDQFLNSQGREVGSRIRWLDGSAAGGVPSAAVCGGKERSSPKKKVPRVKSAPEAVLVRAGVAFLLPLLQQALALAERDAASATPTSPGSDVLGHLHASLQRYMRSKDYDGIRQQHGEAYGLFVRTVSQYLERFTTPSATTSGIRREFRGLVNGVVQSLAVTGRLIPTLVELTDLILRMWLSPWTSEELCEFG
jgi:hypothetical protein